MKKLKSLKDEKGYVVIEVLFLVTVIGILSSIVIPKVDNAFKTIYADYLMKSLYSELRYMQSYSRISFFSDENVFNINKAGRSFVAISSNTQRRYRIRMSDNEELRRYYLRPNFSFEKDFFITISQKGILEENYSRSVSDRIKLTYNSQICNPIIVFDSVGRIRFENPYTN